MSCLRKDALLSDTIGALTLGVPYYIYSIIYPKTLFELLRPLYEAIRLLFSNVPGFL